MASSPRSVATTVPPSGETTAMPGLTPTAVVAITLRARRSIAETLFDPEFATYPRVPSALRLMKKGFRCTPMVAITWLFSASITLTLLDPVLTT